MTVMVDSPLWRASLCSVSFPVERKVGKPSCIIEHHHNECDEKMGHHNHESEGKIELHGKCDNGKPDKIFVKTLPKII